MNKRGFRKAAVMGALLLAAGAVLAQPAAPRPKFDAFDVASIQPTDPAYRGGRFIRMESAHQFVARNYSVQALIAAAYSLTPRTIAGGPAWIDSDPYDIVAGAPNAVRPNHNEQMAMLRKLLADRFQLAFHRERKVLPIYALTVAKGGPKLKESTAPADDPPVLINHVFPDHIALPAHNATIDQFALMMQRAVVDRPVADRTGLTGTYDFDLEWTPDETQFGGQGPRDIPDMPRKPDLFAALQQQLGLKLEASRGPVEVMIIDHVARPSAN
ncbi:MAG TPA: TIGR03435 family protein [Bryobacteraceae bacterium]|nr:TIGR03435 family protein [Bryobacteraceae bacterium]